jgi:hypothetical protein
MAEKENKKKAQRRSLERIVRGMTGHGDKRANASTSAPNSEESLSLETEDDDKARKKRLIARMPDAPNSGSTTGSGEQQQPGENRKFMHLLDEKNTRDKRRMSLDTLSMLEEIRTEVALLSKLVVDTNKRLANVEESLNNNNRGDTQQQHPVSTTTCCCNTGPCIIL